MPFSKLRIATIGSWGHLGDPIEELLTVPNVEFVAHGRALPDDDFTRIRTLVRNPELPMFDDYRQMLRQVHPDLVIVSTWIDRINSIAVDVAAAGCHLICEKPLAIEHADLLRLHQVVTTNKVQCVAMLGNGRHPVMQATEAVIQSGKAGEVVLINAQKSYKWGDRPEWFGRRATYGGTIAWVAIHALEMIHLLTRQNFVSVAAMQSNRAHPNRPDCEDNGIVLLKTSGGVHASVSFDMLRPSAAASHGDDWLRVVCTHGGIGAGLDRGWCRFISEKVAETNLTLPAKGSYYLDLVQTIASGTKTISELSRRSFLLTHTALCARDAADKGTVEQIPPLY